ncbi:MAG: insulinase family protein [Candidatus Fonsibacter sp.]
MIDNFIYIYGGYHNKFKKKTKLYLYEMSNISISTNNNFMKSLLIPITGSNTVSVGIFINAGSRQETEAYIIAHFLEHMTFKKIIT